jgi:hypothetical protein
VNEYESKTGKACPLPKKVSPEEAAAEPQIQAIIQPRILHNAYLILFLNHTKV